LLGNGSKHKRRPIQFDQGGRRFFALRGEEVCWDECLDGEMREDEEYYICAGVLLIIEDRIAKVFFFSRSLSMEDCTAKRALILICMLYDVRLWKGGAGADEA
jgi:hypothetical protein